MAMTRMNDHVGRVLAGRYRLLAPIGAGGSAQVFLAEDTRLKRRVAVKLLHESYARDEAFIRRFRSEAQTAAGLNHPNLLAVFDWGEDEVPFLVTEFIGGGSLRAMLDQGQRLSISQATLIGLEAAKGLDHAHRQGLVHRDLKPANLLFGEDERLRIADFGLARALADAAVTEPSGAVLGTARYASPEQAQGRPLDGSSDIYSLALVLIEAVTGQVPFSVDTTIGTLMARVAEPVPVSNRLAILQPILRAAGAVEPEDRPDAARLATLLIKASEELDPPERLPLAGAIVLADTAVEIDRDPTMLPEPSPGGTVFPDEAPVPPAEIAGPGRLGRRWQRRAARKAARGDRRTGRRVLIGVLTVVLLAAVAAGGYAGYQVLRPEHEVPDLAEQTVANLDELVGDLGFDVQLVGVRRNGAPAGTVVEQDPAEGEKLREGQTLTVTVSRGPEFLDVPVNLTNITQAQSEAAIEAAGFRVGHVSEKYNELVVAGIVQSVITRFDEVPRNSAIDLVVSLGPRPRTIPADAVGRPFSEVAAELEDLSLVVVREDEPTTDVPEGTVTSIDPGAGAVVERDSTVTVRVAVAQVEVPDVTGLDPVSAADALAAVGLRVSQTVGPPNRNVVDTDPGPGTLVDPNSAVTLFTRRFG
ncbi:MAG: PASTA domain-containing protein [Acidimicrobiales bacterium]